jgi:hypothetical protein
MKRRLYRSFLPATKFDHSLVIDNLVGNTNIRLAIGSNRTMTAVVTLEVAKEVRDYLSEAIDQLERGPKVEVIPITAPPGPRDLDYVYGISINKKGWQRLNLVVYKARPVE